MIAVTVLTTAHHSSTSGTVLAVLSAVAGGLAAIAAIVSTLNWRASRSKRGAIAASGERAWLAQNRAALRFENRHLDKEREPTEHKRLENFEDFQRLARDGMFDELAPSRKQLWKYRTSGDEPSTPDS